MQYKIKWNEKTQSVIETQQSHTKKEKHNGRNGQNWVCVEVKDIKNSTEWTFECTFTIRLKQSYNPWL